MPSGDDAFIFKEKRMVARDVVLWLHVQRFCNSLKHRVDGVVNTCLDAEGKIWRNQADLVVSICIRIIPRLADGELINFDTAAGVQWRWDQGIIPTPCVPTRRWGRGGRRTPAGGAPSRTWRGRGEPSSPLAIEVGKTAIVEGLAQRITVGNVPDTLVGARIVEVDMGSMVAGTHWRDMFEQRFKDAIKDNYRVKQRNHDTEASVLPRGVQAVLVTSGQLRNLDLQLQVPPLLLANTLIAAFSRAALPRLAIPLLRHILDCVLILDPAQERRSCGNATVNTGGYGGFRLHLPGDEDTPAASTPTDREVLPLLVAAFSLLFAAATPIRDVADTCSLQV
ncbi:hypothetical protein ZWY2020_023662 [Hordeum vulgare]|nr:hypothetical protein ZWY2020_023662 [Hordeum vulgare]